MSHRAEVERVRTDPHQVVQDARDLVEHRPDPLRALRCFDPEQALDREHVGVLVAHHRHVIQAIHVADRLVERLGFGEFLGAAMQEADVRIGALHDLAVHLQDQAQHAVRGRMLRTEVERVVADLGVVEAGCIHQRHGLCGFDLALMGSNAHDLASVGFAVGLPMSGLLVGSERRARPLPAGFRSAPSPAAVL
jgi:hypothetical protein